MLRSAPQPPGSSRSTSPSAPRNAFPTAPAAPDPDPDDDAPESAMMAASAERMLQSRSIESGRAVYLRGYARIAEMSPWRGTSSRARHAHQRAPGSLRAAALHAMMHGNAVGAQPRPCAHALPPSTGTAGRALLPERGARAAVEHSRLRATGVLIAGQLAAAGGAGGAAIISKFIIRARYLKGERVKRVLLKVPLRYF